MANRGRPRKNKELSTETKQKVEQGLQEVKEEKIITPSKEEVKEMLTPNPKIIAPKNELISEGIGKPLSVKRQEKKDKLNNVLRDLNKKLGKNSIKYADTIEVRERISFGHSSIDKLTGGGVPEGQVITIWGSKGTGKTTVILDLIASAQKNGKQCVYINGERSYDPVYAKKRGINTDELAVVDVNTLEDGLDVILKLCRESVADLIIFDSLHGLAPHGELYAGKAEKEKSVADDTMALRARKLSQFFEMANAPIAEAKCAIVMIGQSRMDLSGFVKLETLTGGHALLHGSRLILKFRRGQKADAPTEKRPTGALTEKGKPEIEDIQIGFDFVIRVEKSQIEGCIEQSEIHLPFLYELGIKDEQ
jgi:protein RecA